MNKMMHVIVLENDVEHFEAIRRAFLSSESSWTVRWAQTIAEYRRLVDELQPDVAVVDYFLNEETSEGLLTYPTEDGPFPVLVMAGFGNSEIAAEMIRRGAVDYIVKSYEAFAAMPRNADRALKMWSMAIVLKTTREKLDAVTAELKAINSLRTVEKTKWNLQAQELNVDAALAANGVMVTTIAAGSVGIVMVKEATALNQYFVLTPTTVGTALMTNAAYTATKDNATTVNVYIDAGVVKLQNKTVSAINVKVGFVGFN